MYGQYPNYPPNDPRIDRNYYDRIRNNSFGQFDSYGNQPPYDPYGNRYQQYPQYDPSRQPPNLYRGPDTYYQQQPTQVNPGYGRPTNMASVCNSYGPKPYNNTNITTSNINIPDYNIPTVEEPICNSTVQEPVNKDILEIIKELKREGYRPTPDSIRLPLYDERYYEPDVIIKGNFYSIVLIPKN